MKYLLALFAGWILTASAPAQLVVNVDPALQMYWLSGSASGAPGGDEDFGYEIFWNNNLPYDGGYTNFLSLSAFTISGNSSANFIMFLHGNGNINGALDLNSGAALTLTGNAAVKFDYSGYSPGLVTSLESKAAANQALPATDGSPAFGLTFRTVAAVPEPSAIALLAGLGLGAGAILFLRRRRGPC